jgi:hypothetical protein
VSLPGRAGALREGGSLAESGDENIYAINHNSVRGTDRDSLVCANNLPFARECIQLECGSTSGFRRPAESAGDDETDDGDVETQ